MKLLSVLLDLVVNSHLEEILNGDRLKIIKLNYKTCIWLLNNQLLFNELVTDEKKLY